MDSTLAFVSTAAPQSLVVGASTPSTNVIDLAGLGSGVADTNIIGNATVFGEDIGIGDGPMIPKLLVIAGNAFTTGTAATLNIALQAAPDAGGGTPGAYVTIVETGAIAVANLTASAVLARFDVPPNFPFGPSLPRFLRLLFQLPAGTSFTAGSIAYAGILTARDDYAAKFYPSNFVVA